MERYRGAAGSGDPRRARRPAPSAVKGGFVMTTARSRGSASDATGPRRRTGQADKFGGPVSTRLAGGTFYGTSQQTEAVAGLVLSVNHYPPEFRTPPHAHADTFLYLVLDGTCMESYGGGTRTVGPAGLVVHPAGAPHTNHWASPGGRCFCIDFGPGWADRVRGYSAFLDTPGAFQGGTPVHLVQRLFREFCRRDTLSPLVIEGLALELVGEATRAAAGDLGAAPGWLRRAREILHDRFAERLTLGTVAAAAGVHPVHLAAVFHRHLGCTVGEYVRRLRVECACTQLRTSSTPLVEIALRAGFADQAHFCRTFKGRTGMTPAAYRRLFGHPA
jgi:AraC family transcriptional regulator